MRQKFSDINVSLRAALNQSPNKGTDKDKRMMYGVVVAEAMQIKDYRGSDYGLELDEAFIKDMVSFANKQKNGVIVNFGHNWDNLAARLGRMNNFVITDNKVNADLKILDSADTTPGKTGLGTHVLNLAEEDPGMMAFSIKFNYKYMFQRDSGGKEVKCYYYEEKKGYIYPSSELGPVYFKFDKLTAVDLVDEGAATNTLFQSQSELVQAAHALLNTPGIEDVLANHHFPVIEQHIGAQKNTGGIIESLKALLGLNTKDPDLLTPLKEDDVDTETLNRLETGITANNTAMESLRNANAELTTQMGELGTKLEAALTRIAQLEAQPAASHNKGDEEETPAVPLRAYHANPMNQKWLERQKQGK